MRTCPPENDDGDPEYGDPYNFDYYCVKECVTDTEITYADNQTNRECVLSCAASPASTFGLDGVCVFNCSDTTWGDPFATTRHCTTSCTYTAGGFVSYGYNQTRLCV